MAAKGAAIIPQLVESITQSSNPSTPASCSGAMAGGDISSSALTIPCQTEIVLDEKTKKELFTDTFCRVCGAVLQFESHRNAHYEGKKHAQRVRLYFLKQELDEMTYKKKKVDRMDFHKDPGLAQDKNKFCSLCNMVFSSAVVAKSHYVGKIHAKKLKQMSGEPSEWAAEADEFSSSPHKETAVPPVAESAPVGSPLSEKSNQQEVSAEQPPSSTDNEFDVSDPNKYCKLCCASFNKPLVAQQHYNGKKHARNEARRRMMEEMEDDGDAMEAAAVGEGIYMCPICNITLTSIEMYQSHMQGNKHQIKENMVANLMKTSKKTFTSFQDELEDYIKIQRARGLEPKTRFRPEKDHCDSCDDIDPAPVYPNSNPYKYFPPHPMSYPSYHSPHSPHPADTKCWEKGSWPPRPTIRISTKTAPQRKRPPSSSESSDYSSDESSGSYKRERRHRRDHRGRDSRHHGRTRRENGSSEQKKRKTEDAYNSKKEKRDEDFLADKSKHRKDKKKKEEPPADKESKKHKKMKKPEDQKTEEELLWDESILGF